MSLRYPTLAERRRGRQNALLAYAIRARQVRLEVVTRLLAQSNRVPGTAQLRVAERPGCASVRSDYWGLGLKPVREPVGKADTKNASRVSKHVISGPRSANVVRVNIDNSREQSESG